MKAIILSPGPSLANYIPQSADLTIGVNRAAIRFPVDVWACGDTPLVEQIAGQIIGNPLLVTYDVSADTLNDHGFKWRGGIFRWTQLADSYLHPSVVNWPWCTFAASIVYAASRGATEIEVYGADWEGQSDWDGVQSGHTRTDERWETERRLFGLMQSELRIPLERI